MPKKQVTFKEWVKLHQDDLAKIAMGIGAAGILGGGFFFYQSRQIQENVVATSQKNIEHNKKLKLEYKKVKNKKPVSMQQGTTNLENAVKAGNKMANLQNQYSTAGTNDKKLKHIVKQIKPLLVSNDDEPSPWFSTVDAKNKGTWQFVSKFTFTQNRVGVIFEDLDKKGNLLAFTTADYLPSSGQFTNMNTTVTVLGDSAVNATGDSKKTRKRELDQQIKAIRKAIKAEGGKYKAPSKKQRQQQEKAAETMQKENEKKYGLDKDLPPDLKKSLKDKN